MTDLRTAAQQALEALEGDPNAMIAVAEGHWDFKCNLAITALRAALAQQAEPVEPVVWSGYDLDGMAQAFSRVIEAHSQRANPFQNPIDMDAQMALRILRGFIPAMQAYTSPPQRKPLMSDKDRPDQGATYIEGYGYVDTRAVRAIERAHGIGGSNG